MPFPCDMDAILSHLSLYDPGTVTRIGARKLIKLKNPKRPVLPRLPCCTVVIGLSKYCCRKVSLHNDWDTCLSDNKSGRYKGSIHRRGRNVSCRFSPMLVTCCSEFVIVMKPPLTIELHVFKFLWLGRMWRVSAEVPEFVNIPSLGRNPFLYDILHSVFFDNLAVQAEVLSQIGVWPGQSNPISPWVNLLTRLAYSCRFPWKRERFSAILFKP